jgi:2-C-methyl-D-erythritol 2,4-cyclodiphosphate synthase
MTDPQLRVGHGFDVHSWSDDPRRHLVLGGTRFPDVGGLVGHSDADPIAHACTDAVLAAAGCPDIGQLFSDSDPAFADADSVELLRRAMVEVAAAGWSVVNVDCTVILDAPKLAPHKAEIEARLSAAVGGEVRVKGKRTEGLDGLQGGVQCHAVALVVKV